MVQNSDLHSSADPLNHSMAHAAHPPSFSHHGKDLRLTQDEQLQSDGILAGPSRPSRNAMTVARFFFGNLLKS